MPSDSRLERKGGPRKFGDKEERIRVARLTAGVEGCCEGKAAATRVGLRTSRWHL